MSPYGLAEGLHLVRRRMLPDRDNPPGLAYCASRVEPEPGIGPLMRVGLLGDLMGLDGKHLDLDESVSAFFADCDALIGNLEGTIAPRPLHPVPEWHHPNFVAELGRMFEPSRFHLNVANNHAADFGVRVFDETADRLRDAGFNVFGTSVQPFADIGSHLRLVAGSMWTNRPCNWISDIDDIGRHPEPSRFLLLYPHWGYELESQPRREILDLGRRLLAGADALVGHHSHLPQPVRLCVVNGRAKVIATSLGGFCYRDPQPQFLYGVVIKLAIGRMADGAWGVAELDWRFVECIPGHTRVRVVIRD